MLNKYIEKNKLCSELLFSDWKEFLDLLYLQGGYVESILWFEYVKISEQSKSIGSGGYIDKINPDYMYAETHIFEQGFDDKSLSEIDEYIHSILLEYPNNKLIPSFFIK